MFITEYECSEEKKAKFVKYLEKHNVIKTFSEIFDKLMKLKEKPENPIDFIREELGDIVIPQETFDNLERELEEAHREIAGLEKTIKELGLEDGLRENDSETELEPEAEPEPEAGTSKAKCEL